jgi:hypothetical protein
MPQRKLVKDIWFLRSTKMVLGRFENNLHNFFSQLTETYFTEATKYQQKAQLHSSSPIWNSLEIETNLIRIKVKTLSFLQFTC